LNKHSDDDINENCFSEDFQPLYVDFLNIVENNIKAKQRFPNIFQRFPKITKNNQRFLKIGEDLRGRSKDVSIIHKQSIFTGNFFSGCQRKDVFPLQNLSIDDVNILVMIHQKWNKGQCLSLPVTAGMGVNRLKIKYDISEVINIFTGKEKEIMVHLHVIEINFSRNLLV